jgi:hypothetical protein
METIFFKGRVINQNLFFCRLVFQKKSLAKKNRVDQLFDVSGETRSKEKLLAEKRIRPSWTTIQQYYFIVNDNRRFFKHLVVDSFYKLWSHAKFTS